MASHFRPQERPACLITGGAGFPPSLFGLARIGYDENLDLYLTRTEGGSVHAIAGVLLFSSSCLTSCLLAPTTSPGPLTQTPTLGGGPTRGGLGCARASELGALSVAPSNNF